MHTETILNRILSVVTLAKNTKKLFLLGLVGLPGSGKSYVSSKLAYKLNIPSVSNDQIRRVMESYLIESEVLSQKKLQIIADKRTDILLENQVSHIIDADLFMFIESATNRINKYSGNLILIKSKC